MYISFHSITVKESGIGGISTVEATIAYYKDQKVAVKVLSRKGLLSTLDLQDLKTACIH